MKLEITTYSTVNLRGAFHRRYLQHVSGGLLRAAITYGYRRLPHEWFVGLLNDPLHMLPPVCYAAHASRGRGSPR